MPQEDAFIPGYRDEFNFESKAAEYDATQYGSGSWSSLVWGLEQALLATLLDDPAFVPRRERYLDFACGTARVTSFVSLRFVSTTAVDISEAMLERARAKVPLVDFIRGDVIADPELAGGDFDLVTSFRFVLNAEPGDRLAALHWMRDRLRDGSSRVIVNNHANLWTHKAVTHAARQLKRRGRLTTGNVLSHREMVRLISRAGFNIESVHGMGHFGGQAMRAIPYYPMSRLQQRLSGVPGIQKFGEDQLYVLSRR